jgi:hypothetical protein
MTVRMRAKPKNRVSNTNGASVPLDMIGGTRLTNTTENPFFPRIRPTQNIRGDIQQNQRNDFLVVYQTWE